MDRGELVDFLYEERLFLRPTQGGRTRTGRIRSALEEALLAFGRARREGTSLTVVRQQLLEAGLVVMPPETDGGRKPRKGRKR